MGDPHSRRDRTHPGASRCLPRSLALAARVYTGSLGSTSATANATEIEYIFYFVTSESLGAREGHVLGFQNFLNRVESNNFRRMVDSSEMFERYLPYAMALQVEKKWARASENLYKEPPD